MSAELNPNFEIKTLDCNNFNEVIYKINKDTALYYYKKKLHLYYEMSNVNEVLVSKKYFVVYKGLRDSRDWWNKDFNKKESFCYCSIPEYYYDSEGQKIKEQAGWVFLIFISDKWVYKWRWEKSDVDGFPKGSSTNRFENRTYLSEVNNGT